MQANGFDLWIRVYCDNASAGVLVPLVSGEFPFHNAIPTVILARRVAVHPALLEASTELHIALADAEDASVHYVTNRSGGRTQFASDGTRQ